MTSKKDSPRISDERKHIKTGEPIITSTGGMPHKQHKDRNVKLPRHPSKQRREPT